PQRDQTQPFQHAGIEDAAQAPPADRRDQPLFLVETQRRGGNARVPRDLRDVQVSHRLTSSRLEVAHCGLRLSKASKRRPPWISRTKPMTSKRSFGTASSDAPGSRRRSCSTDCSNRSKACSSKRSPPDPRTACSTSAAVRAAQRSPSRGCS